MDSEQIRLEEAREAEYPLKKWGPYLSERQVGDGSRGLQRGGDAWNFFTTIRLARGLPMGRGRHRRPLDDKQRLCFALALWNGKDPILKERLFGLTTAKETTGRMSRNTTSTSTRRRPIRT